MVFSCYCMEKGLVWALGVRVWRWRTGDRGPSNVTNEDQDLGSILLSINVSWSQYWGS
jgi:hypothetical protein